MSIVAPVLKTAEKNLRNLMLQGNLLAAVSYGRIFLHLPTK